MATTSAATEIITRVLYVAPLVHVYAIPPLQSNRGHVASVWTSSPKNEIFTARLRVIETSNPSEYLAKPPNPAAKSIQSSSSKPSLKVDILLEDATSSELFAGAQYMHASVVESTVDSSRFFAIRLTGEGGRKAVLGIGFEERSEALDFSIALQEARKVLGLEAATPATPSTPSTPITPTTVRGVGSSMRNARGAPPPHPPTRPKPEQLVVEEEKSLPVKRDWSLKEGQMLHVDLGGKKNTGGPRSAVGGKHEILPPSAGGLKSGTASTFMLLPPPPSAKDIREGQKNRSENIGIDDETKTLEELGFDDGEFGEFQ